MKRNFIKIWVLGIATVWFGGEYLHAQSGVDIIVNESVTTSSLDKNALKDIYLGKTSFWQGGQAIAIFVVTDKTDSVIQEVTGMSASQFKTHWQRLTFSGRGKQPKESDSIDKIVSLVASSKGAIAFVPSGTTLAGVKKIELK